MRPFTPNPQRLREYVAKRGGPAGKAVLLLKMCEEHMEALSLLAGTPKVIERNVMSNDGKRKAKSDDGKYIMETVPVLDDNGQPVYEDSEMTETALVLYQICSTLINVVREDPRMGGAD